MGVRLILALGAAGVVGTMMVVQKIDHAMNYVPVNATVTDVESSCYLQRVERGLLTKTTETTERMDCDEAEDLRRTDASYEGMKVLGTIDISFDYISPVDQLQHKGSLSYAYQNYAPLAAASTGTELPILASKSDPDRTARDYDRMSRFATLES